MALPKPQQGLVIRYNYLFAEDAAKGLEEAPYDRPCMILRVLHADTDAPHVYVLPITHAKPHEGTIGIKIPASTARRLGLDADQSWLIVDDVNDFIWPGPDVRSEPEYGMVPPSLYNEARNQFVALYRQRKVEMTKRTE